LIKQKRKKSINSKEGYWKIYSQEVKRKGMKINEESLGDLWDRIKRNYVCAYIKGIINKEEKGRRMLI
jgi:hypothetical protein